MAQDKVCFDCKCLYLWTQENVLMAKDCICGQIRSVMMAKDCLCGHKAIFVVVFFMAKDCICRHKTRSLLMTKDCVDTS